MCTPSVQTVLLTALTLLSHFYINSLQPYWEKSLRSPWDPHQDTTQAYALEDLITIQLCAHCLSGTELI